MLNGTLRMGSGGDTLQTDDDSTLIGEFGGKLMATGPRSFGTLAVATPGISSDDNAGFHSSGSQSGDSVGGLQDRHADGGSEAPARGGLSRLGLAGGLGGVGGEEEEEEQEQEEAVAWHSLEATPLTDTATGKQVSGDPGRKCGQKVNGPAWCFGR